MSDRVPSCRVAVLTPPGRGPLAVVGVDGPDALQLIDAVFRGHSDLPVAGRPDASICVGRWNSAAVGAGEELVVVRLGPTRAEVHCHGGLAASAAVLRSLVDLGATAVPWPAWLAGCGDEEIVIEARRSLTAVAGPKAAKIIARQMSGLLAAEMAAALAMPDGPDVRDRRARLLRAARVGLRLTSPWRVVFTGRVNAGKSSLINALAGHGRMLVSPEAGTTRDLVETRVVLGCWEIDLIDTAGLRDDAGQAGPVERAGVHRAREAVAEADLVVEVAAADCDPGLWTIEAAAGRPRLAVLSKADLLPDAASADAGWLRTSARTGTGVDRLAARIVELLVPEEAESPELLAGAVPFTPRQVACLTSRATIDLQTARGPAV